MNLKWIFWSLFLSWLTYVFCATWTIRELAKVIEKEAIKYEKNVDKKINKIINGSKQ